MSPGLNPTDPGLMQQEVANLNSCSLHSDDGTCYNDIIMYKIRNILSRNKGHKEIVCDYAYAL